MCQAREQRGRLIAEKCKIIKSGNLWKVPAQSREGTYSVRLDRLYCSCPDFAERGEDCKHIYAVRFRVTKTEKHDDGTETVTTVTVEQVKKPTYPQDWANYNRAQTNEHRLFHSFLAEMCGALPKPETKRGRTSRALSAGDAAFAAISKVYSTMSARRFLGDLEESRQLGYVSRVPHFNSVLNFFDTASATGILKDFVSLSASPLVGLESQFAIDATGFSGSSYFRWLDEKHGVERREIKWIKLHAIVGVRTNAVVACKITESPEHDSPQLPELVHEARKQFTIGELSADKAYTSVDNFNVVESIGATFYPKFKRNTTGQVGGAFERAFLLMKLNQEAYDKKYHLRSNVESTFSGVKRLIGESLRSKNELSMTNEALAKVVCYNVTRVIHAMYECGIDPKFVIQPRCTPAPQPAQEIGDN